MDTASDGSKAVVDFSKITLNTAGKLTDGSGTFANTALNVASDRTKDVSDVAGTLIKGTGRFLSSGVSIAGDVLDTGASSFKTLRNAVSSSISKRNESLKKTDSALIELTGGLKSVKTRLNEEFESLAADVRRIFYQQQKTAQKKYNATCTGFINTTCPMYRKKTHDSFKQLVELSLDEINNIVTTTRSDINSSSTQQELDKYFKNGKDSLSTLKEQGQLNYKKFLKDIIAEPPKDTAEPPKGGNKRTMRKVSKRPKGTRSKRPKGTRSKRKKMKRMTYKKDLSM